MNVAKQCFRKWHWKYIEGLEPIDQGPNLKLGMIVHDAFYQYYNGLPVGQVQKFIEDKFTEEQSKVEQSEQEQITILRAIALGMWTSFPKDLLDFQTILPEHPFSLDFHGTPIEGRLDGLVMKDNKFWVRELKTTSLAQRQFKERMNVSEQAVLYFWAARKMGFPVQGIMYDALHKPLLRKNQSENAEGFAIRIRLDYKNRPEHYFQREFVYKTDQDVKNFEDDMYAFQTDLMRKLGPPDNGDPKCFYRNTNSCLSFNSECQYKRICFSEKPDELMLKLFYTKKEPDNARPNTGSGSAEGSNVK